eukprot:TRINITY_DN46959_c0_g1_i1.p3 TRINITY_DN46959_c0_g1~~TRINITY_DN46959_c0_g1_i1.p3  ORF type:complete len:181 (+),score=37.21 TRINITY_DN46959_c0_g1_i1:853-1395(+)
MWKIPEESCLVFRCPDLVSDAICMITSSDWITGSDKGKLCVWNQLKKKPTWVSGIVHQSEDNLDVCSWIQSLAVCHASDLVASGAGDGWIRLWGVVEGQHGKQLKQIGVLPCKGYVNDLQFSKNGNLLVAAVGQEPRLGRWDRDKIARNCVAVFKLEYNEDNVLNGSEDSGDESMSDKSD